MVIALGPRKFSKNGSKGAKIHFTSTDLEITKWKHGTLVSIEYDCETNEVTIKPIEHIVKHL